MLFKFKSKACPDLIMLEPDGRRVLQAMLGHDPVQGVIVVADLPQALARLEAAVAHDEALRRQLAEQATQDPTGGLDPPEDALEARHPIRLAQRASPMLKMLRRCMAEEADLVWGV